MRTDETYTGIIQFIDHHTFRGNALIAETPLVGFFDIPKSGMKYVGQSVSLRMVPARALETPLQMTIADVDMK